MKYKFIDEVNTLNIGNNVVQLDFDSSYSGSSSDDTRYKVVDKTTGIDIFYLTLSFADSSLSIQLATDLEAE